MSTTVQHETEQEVFLDEQSQIRSFLTNRRFRQSPGGGRMGRHARLLFGVDQRPFLLATRGTPNATIGMLCHFECDCCSNQKCPSGTSSDGDVVSFSSDA